MPSRAHAVKPDPVAIAAPARYHHGALRAALLAAAEVVIAERGVDGFSLREVARRAGVTPGAPRHHFPDARALLTAVAAGGFADLGAALADADAAAMQVTGRDPGARVRAQGEAYVRFALAHPARFDVMWRRTRVDVADPAYAAASQQAFDVLLAAVDVAPTGVRPVEADPRALASWSVVHGFARLALDGAFGVGPGAAHAAAVQLLPALLATLRV
ncbi:MAG TPA: TetR/AcrR family transcriptional regulator [Gemmatirosa sp.]